MRHDSQQMQGRILAILPGRPELEPYVTAIASLKDFQSSNEELIAATNLLDDSAILERATVAYLAKGPDGAGKAEPAVARRALRSLARRGLAGERKAQRVLFQRDQRGTVSAYPVSGRVSYWYRSGE